MKNIGGLNWKKLAKTGMIGWFVVMFMSACQKPAPTQPLETSAPNFGLYEIDNLVAWCVVPFDKMNRGPEERASMLQELGFKKFAYDWREQHLQDFPSEVQALKQQGVALTSVWWWIDGQGDDLLGEGNRRLLHYMDSLDISCDIWMSFDDRFFEGLDEQAMLEKATQALIELNEEASTVGASLQLYNHGSWFGDPRNQIKIIENSGIADLGIVYNFHHAHQQIDDFEKLLMEMLPYLNTVNINGMNSEGPKILTVGEGQSEKQMLSLLKESGFDGNIGIIGHLQDEDVEVVLARNIKGLQQIVGSW